MKKTILSISVLSLMSFTSFNLAKIYSSIDLVQDMKEWMQQDIENGNIDQELGEIYIDNLKQVESDLIDFTN